MIIEYYPPLMICGTLLKLESLCEESLEEMIDRLKKNFIREGVGGCSVGVSLDILPRP